MPTLNSTADLGQRIDRFCKTHLIRRMILATISVAVIALLVGFLYYGYDGNLWVSVALATGVFLLAGNIVILSSLTAKKHLSLAKRWMIGALNNPTRIHVTEKQLVQLEDDAGGLFELNLIERNVWATLVVPYLTQSQTTPPKQSIASVGGGVSNVENKIMEKRLRELQLQEKEMQAQRSSIKAERADYELRLQQLKLSENKLQDTVSRAEAKEAVVARMQERLSQRITEDQTSSSVDRKQEESLLQKESELAAKELELELQEKRLVEEQAQLELQRVQLAGMEGGLLLESESAGKVDQKMQELNDRETELEERLRYVADVENDLINRLNLLCEREASVEQSEVNAGVRPD